MRNRKSKHPFRGNQYKSVDNPRVRVNGKYRRLYESLLERWTKNFIAVLLISFVVVYAIPHWQEVMADEIVEKEIEKLVIVKDVSTPAVLSRIAECESGNTHYGKTGQVLAMGNKNGSVDVGRFQINISIWGQKATELGYDLWDEKGNEEMARWIFENYGSEPWFLTAKCWK